MRYIKLGRTGLDISPLAIGAMTYGEPDRGHPVWSLDEESSRPLIKHALEAGINFFDTANLYSYGSSEEGSTAILGPSTTATVTTQSDREITVNVVGQAVFAVTPNPRRSFNVRVGTVIARVLGTTFFVQRYATDAQASIVVTNGRVAVGRLSNPRSSRNAEVILSAQHLGIIPDSGAMHVVNGVDSDAYTAWTTGRLVFQRTLVRDVIATLGRTYDVDIRLADTTLAMRTLTWTFQIAGYSRDGAVDMLSSLLGVHAERRGRVFTLIAGRERQTPPARHSFPSSQESAYGK